MNCHVLACREIDALIDPWSLFVNKLTHVVWSRCQPGSLVALPWPNSSRAKANISCKKSANKAEVWALDCESLDGKRGKCPGNFVRLHRTFPLALACSQLRSQRQWQQHPSSPVFLCVHPFAALLAFKAGSLCVHDMHPHRWADQTRLKSHFPPTLREKNIFSHLHVPSHSPVFFKHSDVDI